MFDRNNIGYGLLLGIVLPALAFATLWGVFLALSNFGLMSDEGFRPYFRERTTSIVAIALNAYLLNKFYDARSVNSMRGVVISTLLLVGAWLWFFWDIIF